MVRNYGLKMLTLVVLLTSHSVSVQAIILWDQQPDPNGQGIIDQVFPDFPEFSSYMVSDVVFSTDVSIDSVTTYFTNVNTSWPQNSTGTAILNIFADDGALDTEDPTAGLLVTADFSVGGNWLELMASGLAIDLLAGTYWIGLTPVLSFDPFGQEFHQQATPNVGAHTQLRNPGGGFAFGTEWVEAGSIGSVADFDAAITIRGEEASIPEPTILALLSLGLAGLGFTRRKMKT
jgi:hypothetical protein